MAARRLSCPSYLVFQVQLFPQDARGVCTPLWCGAWTFAQENLESEQYLGKTLAGVQLDLASEHISRLLPTRASALGNALSSRPPVLEGKRFRHGLESF